MKALIVALPILVSGCACQNVGINTIAISLANEGRPVVGESVLISWQNDSHKESKVAVTGQSGEARAEFQFLWTGYILLLPDLGTLPRHGPRPEYVIQVGAGKPMRVLEKDTAYSPGLARWETKVHIPEKEPNKAPEPTTMAVTPRATEGDSK